MFIQCFLDQWPTFFQVSFSVFWEECSEAAFFKETFRIIFSCEGWLFPSIRNSEKFRFIYCHKYKAFKILEHYSLLQQKKKRDRIKRQKKSPELLL